MHTKKQKNGYHTCDAAGIKLRKTAGSTTSDYIGNFVYENDILKYIITEYGKIAVETAGGLSQYTRQYNLTDHLGNVRVTFNENGTILQEDSYYPFGMTMNGLNYQNVSDEDKNLYLYNGKELQEDFGLDWYDYGARFYDAQLGRWYVPDALASDAPGWSPYRYGFNNPISITDPDGNFEDWWVNEESGSLTHAKGNENPDPGNSTHLGEDGMFGEAGKEIEDFDNSKNAVTNLDTKDSKKLAKKGGYKLVPQKVLSEKNVNIAANSITPSGSVSVINTTTTEVWGDLTYIKKDVQLSNSESTLLQTKDIGINRYRNVSIEKRTYGKSNNFLKKIKKIKNFINPQGKNDPPEIFIGWDKYPQNGNLRNFKNRL